MAGLFSRFQTSNGAHFLVYWCIQLGHLFSLFRETVRSPGIEGPVLSVLGMSALHSRAAAVGSRLQESSALSWGPAHPATHSSPPAWGLFFFNILERLFLYHKFVTKIVQLRDCVKVLPDDYELK